MKQPKFIEIKEFIGQLTKIAKDWPNAKVQIERTVYSWPKTNSTDFFAPNLNVEVDYNKGGASIIIE